VRELNFTPRYTLEEGLLDALEDDGVIPIFKKHAPDPLSKEEA
jgi:hypothetical protein